MRKTRALAAVALTAMMVAVPALGQHIKLDSTIPAYKRTGGVSGSLSSVGSDTLNNLMTLWAEGFKKEYPNIKIQIEGKGSSTAPPALISGTAQLGPMSRKMKGSELDEFEKKFGYKPTALPVALDGLAVYVNKDNPLEELTLRQVDAIFSKTRNGGHSKDITTWGDLGLNGAWADKPISLYGRNSASGTYGYFKQHALFKGDYKDTVKEQPGSASVVQGVTEDLYGIGYSGIGYKTSGVKALKIASEADDPYHGTSYEEVATGAYPLARFLFIYINKAPNSELDPLIREFMKYVVSREGQETVVKDGYLPLSGRIIDTQMASLH